MALALVGAGFGRTGTKSLKLALERLGFGPCHHMYEVRRNPEQLPFWQAAAAGRLPDWDEVFAGYRACVDWPAAAFWREIAEHYPAAKVLLTVRPEDAWIDSIYATIYPRMRDCETLESGHARASMSMARSLIVERTFGGRLDDREHAKAVFRAHNETVRRSVPPERLLVYRVGEGWEPLCRFLDVPIPDDAFPHINSTEEFRERHPGLADLR